MHRKCRKTYVLNQSEANTNHANYIKAHSSEVHKNIDIGVGTGGVVVQRAPRHFRVKTLRRRLWKLRVWGLGLGHCERPGQGL